MCNRDKESLANGTKGDLLNEDDDFYEDAKDNNMQEDELNEDELRDVRNEELKIREEEENILSEEAKQERREDAKGMRESANKLYLNSQYEEAIQGYTQALDRCPLCFKEDRAKCFSNRAQAKFKQDNKDGAIEDWSEAIDLDSNYLKAILR
jgi:tetratricopeptide (TPR) repeat protein